MAFSKGKTSGSRADEKWDDAGAGVERRDVARSKSWLPDPKGPGSSRKHWIFSPSSFLSKLIELDPTVGNTATMPVLIGSHKKRRIRSLIPAWDGVKRYDRRMS